MTTLTTRHSTRLDTDVASSGRVPKAARRLMGQTLIIRGTVNTGYGDSSASGPEREVACLLEPNTDTARGRDDTNTTSTWAAYCDDIHITTKDYVKLPDGSEPSIDGVETYYDAKGPVYQVLRMT
jgi:hypothetical protein